MNTIKCPGCGVMFRPVMKDQKYHNKMCGHYARKRLSRGLPEMRGYTKTCKKCGKSFTPKSGQEKYCGDPCQYKQYKDKVYRDRACNMCGKSFTPVIKTQRYCGEPCKYRQYVKKNFKSKKCLVCGKSFVPKNRLQKICHDPCEQGDLLYSSHKTKHEECRVCHKPLDGRTSYCGDECMKKGKNRGKIWRNKERKTALLKQYSWLCVYCGASMKGLPLSKIHLDHVVPKSRGGKIKDNLAPSCPGCNISKNDNNLLVWLWGRL